MWANVFLLILTALTKVALTAWTFGMMVCLYRHTVLCAHQCVQVPAGIFLPTIAIGACMGRAVGLITSVALGCVVCTWYTDCLQARTAPSLPGSLDILVLPARPYHAVYFSRFLRRRWRISHARRRDQDDQYVPDSYLHS